jgi:hypothetical protein
MDEGLCRKSRITRKADGGIRTTNHTKRGEGRGRERPDGSWCGKEQSRLVKASKTFGAQKEKVMCLYGEATRSVSDLKRKRITRQRNMQ